MRTRLSIGYTVPIGVYDARTSCGSGSCARLRHGRHRFHRRAARLASESGELVRFTYRNESRLGRLAGTDAEPVEADVLDRAAFAAPSAAARPCITAPATSAPGPRRVWRVNALAPRLAVEAAAAEEVRQVVVTSSVAGIGPAPPDRPGTEDDFYRGGGLGLTYPDAKHEGEAEALAAGARLGIEVVVVNPSYVFGPALDRSTPGETSSRMIGNYLRGRLPADRGRTDQRGRRARRGQGPPARGRARHAGRALRAGRRDLSWVELFERVNACPASATPCSCCRPRRRRWRAPPRTSACPG